VEQKLIHINNSEPVLELGEFEIMSNLFKPGEAAEMAYVSTDLIRLWRSRGVLPWDSSSAGHNNFTVSQIAYIALCSRMTVLGYQLDVAIEQAAKWTAHLTDILLFVEPYSFHMPGSEDFGNDFMDHIRKETGNFKQNDWQYLVSYQKDEWDLIDLEAFACMSFEVAAVLSVWRIANRIKSGTDRNLFRVYMSDEEIERKGRVFEMAASL
jgi:DNA-binding transcriptional MerR regulator